MLHSLPFSYTPDADPLPPPSAMLPYIQQPLMCPGYDKTPNPNPNSIKAAASAGFTVSYPELKGWGDNELLLNLHLGSGEDAICIGRMPSV